jgi:catechol 2,3-dioxygenase-like lactoylglutathione lyase family enzyme
MLHHIELYVGNLDRSIEFWSPLMVLLGYKPSRWDGGMNYESEQHYFSMLEAPRDHLAAGFHRKRVGLNHLAFKGKSRAHVDEIAAWAKTAGHSILYDDRYPFATGPDYYAVFLEDPDRMKIEVVAPFED